MFVVQLVEGWLSDTNSVILLNTEERCRKFKGKEDVEQRKWKTDGDNKEEGKKKGGIMSI